MTCEAKTYSGKRALKDIMKAVVSKGWEWNQQRYDSGSDFVTFEFRSGRKKLIVVYNTINGGFIVEDKGVMITEESTDMDAVKWYAALLDLIYLREKDVA
jgi:hypothetical protein